MSLADDLKQTPLYERHVAAGARLVDFAGYAMPLHYSGIVAEHKAVRQAAGLFDVSHMGQLVITGPKAGEYLASMVVSDITQLPPGKARYTHLCDEQARIIDDIIVYHLPDERYLIVPNAANVESVFSWMSAKAPAQGVNIDNQSKEWYCLALQGPKAAEVLAGTLDPGVAGLPPFAVKIYNQTFGGLVLARTGYTGEWGVELMGPAGEGRAVWKALVEAGREHGLALCGLGARDTLRLEKGYLLSGQDFESDRTSLETGCGWLVDWDHEFVGREALLAQKEAGYERLTGIKLLDRGVVRPGCAVLHHGKEVAELTSGGPSVMLKCSIGLTYLPTNLRKPGTDLQVVLRGKPLNAVAAKLPFL